MCLYSAAITFLLNIDQLREIKTFKSKSKMRHWLTQMEESITYFSKTIGQLAVIKNVNKLTPIQNTKREKNSKRKCNKSWEIPGCLVCNQNFIL